MLNCSICEITYSAYRCQKLCPSTKHFRSCSSCSFLCVNDLSALLALRQRPTSAAPARPPRTTRTSTTPCRSTWTTRRTAKVSLEISDLTAEFPTLAGSTGQNSETYSFIYPYQQQGSSAPTSHRGTTSFPANKNGTTGSHSSSGGSSLNGGNAHSPPSSANALKVCRLLCSCSSTSEEQSKRGTCEEEGHQVTLVGAVEE